MRLDLAHRLASGLVPIKPETTSPAASGSLEIKSEVGGKGVFIAYAWHAVYYIACMTHQQRLGPVC